MECLYLLELTINTNYHILIIIIYSQEQINNYYVSKGCLKVKRTILYYLTDLVRIKCSVVYMIYMPGIHVLTTFNNIPKV